MSKIYQSDEREAFYARVGMPFWDSYRTVGKHSVAHPYALYTALPVEAQLVERIKTASVEVGKVFDVVGGMVRKLDDTQLETYGFTATRRQLLRFGNDDQIFCARLGWAVTSEGLKLLEINSEKPTFWLEPEMINAKVAQHFKLSDPNKETLPRLRTALGQAIQNAVKKEHAHIGYVVRSENFGDLQTMRWLLQQSGHAGEALYIDDLDFAKKTNKPFSRQTGTEFDALVFWYPLEFIDDLVFANGEKFKDILFESIEAKQCVVIHGLAALAVQPKSILAFITDNADQIFTGSHKDARQYFLPTYLTPEPLGSSYFAKPIWGREGRGCYAVRDSQKEYSKLQDGYYITQPMIYQQLVDLPTAIVGDKELTLMYEAWIYRNDDQIVNGSVGIRANSNKITDESSYFLPIGLESGETPA